LKLGGEVGEKKKKTKQKPIKPLAESGLNPHQDCLRSTEPVDKKKKMMNKKVTVVIPDDLKNVLPFPLARKMLHQ
jgi:hypothetical protein